MTHSSITPNTFKPGTESDDTSDVIRELDRRTNDGISVTLLWDAETNRVFVSVLEERDGTWFEFEVAGADAAEAFHHPYAYAGHGPLHGALAA